MTTRTTLTAAVAVALCAAAAVGCKSNEFKYQPRAAYQGEKASVPAVPSVPGDPVKQGEDFTVWGASYSLRNPVHKADVTTGEVSIVGYVVKTNLPDAPPCSVHRAGKADPEDCRAPLPAFWIGDAKDADVKDAIKVMGFASNFAQIFEAIQQYRAKNAKPYQDPIFGRDIPNPIVNTGAKVRVKGKYGTTYTGSATGTGADPVMGQLEFVSLEYLEAPAEPGSLPSLN